MYEQFRIIITLVILVDILEKQQLITSLYVMSLLCHSKLIAKKCLILFIILRLLKKREILVGFSLDYKKR